MWCLTFSDYNNEKLFMKLFFASNEKYLHRPRSAFACCVIFKQIKVNENS